MHDLLLWRYLRQSTPRAAADLVPLLEELAGRSVRQRMPFFGILDGALIHPDATVRAAAQSVLGGAQGIPVWRWLVAGLRDVHLDVRLAAVKGLRASAAFDPARWVHAVFHPDPEVRSQARALEAPPGFASLFPHEHPFTGVEAHGGAAADMEWPGSPVPAAEFLPIENILAATTLSPGGQEALTKFLERGTDVDIYQRQRVAEHLCRFGYPDIGLPILVQLISGELMYANGADLETAIRAIVAFGSIDLENQLMDVLYNRSWVDDDQPALAHLVTHAAGLDTRYWARDRLYATTIQGLRLARLARAFAWGVQMGHLLTGQRFGIEMLVNDVDLGYTRLRENKLFITPLPILRGERGGVEVVRGLILHEYGHHLFHKGEEAEAVWKQADEGGLGRLLNLVADEHLERNLRQRSPRYGNLLKILNAYAFQYNMRELAVTSLLRYLGPYADAILPQVPLAAARRPGNVMVASGRLLREMEGAGHSFARFVRALRMGLGNRTGDPRVAQALALFKPSFRRYAMPQLLEVARKLREIFGQEADMLDDFGLERAMSGDEAEWLGTGPNSTPQAVKDAVDGLLKAASRDGEQRSPGNVPASWGLNLRPEETFKLIDKVIPVPHDPGRHAGYAQRVARAARLLRRYFQDLGLGIRPQRGRLQGRLLDRTRTRDLVLKNDPRILISRKVERVTDLFLGVAIDCSGSMAGNKLEQAKLFGTLLAEALKGQRGVDLRVIGFTDRAIYDAGNARLCGVHDLKALDGNNDAAALWHAYRLARASKRKARLLVMISDGLPTECSVAALKALVARLTRWNYCCAQVAVQPLEQICFPHYVLLVDQDFDAAVRRFGQVVMRLVRQALGMR
jgi:hypothetical protein